MKNTLLLIITIWFSAQTALSQIKNERTLSFDADWKFKKGQGLTAQASNYNDADWRILDLPHDWSIEDLAGQVADSVQGPFSKASLGKMSTGL